MALTHLAFTILLLMMFEDSEANKTILNIKPILDPKRRSDIVDEAFLEQKDILLDMLELKLKEVKDKKKKKGDLAESKNIRHIDAVRHDDCSNLLKNVDVKVKINGISAVGEADVKLKYGNSGKGVVNLNATGISNIGQAEVELGVGDSAVFIPGLSNLFVDRKLFDCVKKTTQEPELNITTNIDKTRKNIENETIPEIPKTSHSAVPLTNTFQTTTATAYVYTSPTTPPVTQTPIISLYSTPYLVRTDAVYPPQPQPTPGNGFINAV